MKDSIPCRLCGESGSPRVRSHIYPRFTFRRMKEKDGHFWKFDGRRRSWDSRRFQDDCFEYLLCRRCERHLARWESSVARVLSRGLFDSLAPEKGSAYAKVQIPDYSATKLYLLSLLWRASVASLDQFSGVDLGGRHEDRIGKMLLVDDPGESWQYGCFISVPFFETDEGRMHRPPVGFMPETIRWPHDKGIRLVRMLIDGILLHFSVGSDDCMNKFRGNPIALQKSGPSVIGVKNALDMPFLHEYLREIYFAGNSPE